MPARASQQKAAQATKTWHVTYTTREPGKCVKCVCILLGVLVALICTALKKWHSNTREGWVFKPGHGLLVIKCVSSIRAQNCCRRLRKMEEGGPDEANMPCIKNNIKWSVISSSDSRGDKPGCLDSFGQTPLQKHLRCKLFEMANGFVSLGDFGKWNILIANSWKRKHFMNFLKLILIQNNLTISFFLKPICK